MDEQVLKKSLENVRGVKVDLSRVQAHVINPEHVRGVISDTGLNNPAHIPLVTFPHLVPRLIGLRLAVDAFGKALHATLRNCVNGYTMQLRQHGNTIYTLQWNWAKRPADGAKDWNPSVPMHVASVSKLITAIAMTKLLNDQSMSYDTPIINFLPTYWAKGPGVGSITFRHLMTHTSGLNYNTVSSESDFGFMKSQIAAGTSNVGKYWYQNMNFGLCRILISTINGNIAPAQTFPGLNDAFWDVICIDAYANYVRSTVFSPAGATGPTMDHPSTNALAYNFPVSGNGLDTGDVSTKIGGTGWHISCAEMLDVMGTLRRKGSIMTNTQAQTMLDNWFGIDVKMGTPAGTLYNKNGAWGWDGKAEQSLAYFLPEDMELVIMVNSPVDSPEQFFRNVVTDVYLDALRPANSAAPCLFQLHNDGKIWQYTGTPMSGWQLLDNNPATKAIISPPGGGLYQLHNNGKIWRYTGTPITGWELLDQNPATVSLAATGTHLYQRHNVGSIWEYIGPPVTGWKMLDNNPATVAIAATGAALYQLHNTGKIWQLYYTDQPAWNMIDTNPATVAIAASGGHLYQIHKDGKIWEYTGTPMSGWQLLDNNPATMAIVASGEHLYQIHETGLIWQYMGTPLTGWQLLDNNLQTAGIAASGNRLYQKHKSGLIWEYTGIPLTGWKMLDNNPATVAIVAGYLSS
jgi:CubicO group peptidase (beta-lactamase class C family)